MIEEPQTLSEEDLAANTGESVEFVRRVLELGIVPRREGELPFVPSDMHRVRLARSFERSGITLEAIGDAIAAGRLSFDFVDALLPDAAPLSNRTFGDVADELGIPLESLTLLYAMWGLPRPEPDDVIRADDAPTFAEWKTVFPPEVIDADVLAQGARLFGEVTARLADWGMTLYRTYVERPLVAAGMTPQQVLDASAAFAEISGPVMQRQLVWLLSRKLEHDAFQVVVEHVEAAVEAEGRGPRPAARHEAIAFVDLSGYTALTEELGDQAAAERSAAMGTLLQEIANAHGGRVVKLLGDGAMLHFPDAGRAVLGGLEIVDRVEDAGLPPARVGIAAGAMVFREGDYFGRVVNLAARLLGSAGPREVLATAEVAAAADAEFDDLGPVELKGIAEPVPVFRVAGQSTRSKR